MIHVQCRSHYVSHFAAFFIVARAKISVVESCLSSDASRLAGEGAPVGMVLLQLRKCFKLVVLKQVRFACGSDVRY